MSLRSAALGTLALATLLAAPLAAQRAGAPPGGYQNALSINPLSIPFGWVNAEYERATGAGTTLGVSASHLGDGGEALTSGEVRFRYYPSEQGLRGFSVGLGAGWARIEDDGGFGTLDEDEVASGPTLSVNLDYNWLLGARRRLLVGVGVGGKRLFIEDRENDGGYFAFDDLRAYPTLRFVVGLAF